MSLTPNQKTFAWVALGLGVIALVWGLMRIPDMDAINNNSSEMEQRDAATNSNAR